METNPLLGIEVEFRGLLPHYISPYLKEYGRINDDRSIRTNPILIGQEKTKVKYNLIPVDSKTEKFFFDNVRFERGDLIGTEYVTKPLSLIEARSLAWVIAETLGHLPFLPEASIHIHINMIGKPWVEVHKVLLLFLYLEQGFYQLAAGGNVHRGEYYRRRLELRPVYDDYRYCRPLSVSIGVRDADDPSDILPCIDVNALIDATNATELMASWGRLDRIRRVPHYMPHRLMGLNLTSLPRQGTLEWRIFDARYTLLPYFVDLVVETHEAAEKHCVEDLRKLARNGFLMAALPKKKITRDVLENFFGKREWIHKLWGDGGFRLKGISDRLLLSHYDTQQRNQWSICREAPLTTWINNRENTDDFSNDYPIYE